MTDGTWSLRRQAILFYTCAVILLCKANAFVPLYTESPRSTKKFGHATPFRVRQDASMRDYEFDDDINENTDGNRRRTLLSLALIPAAAIAGSESAHAAVSQKPFTFLVKTKNATEPIRKDPVDVETPSLSSETCLIRLLPVKNPIWQTLATSLLSLSSLRSENVEEKTWKDANRRMQSSLLLVDNKRAKLEPLFIQDESTQLQIAKAERGERLIESLRTEIVGLIETTKAKNTTATFLTQKNALLALADIGELLVPSFPFDVPNEGKFSFLPRLLGRCRVTFSFKRGTEFLGNVTIIADGFAAPITAGNFVDLSARQFYTGLPIKQAQKKLGGSRYFLPYQLRGIETLEDRIFGIEAPEIKSDSATVTLPILGSFQEGFYDPLTAKPRRLPLEIIRSSKLSYSRGFSDLSSEASLESSLGSKPLLSFDIPGLVAMNHPDNNVNGASSEFFSLQLNTMPQEKRKLFDGNYAPFGYIVGGFDVYQKLRGGDVIDATEVGEWGQLNLVKKSPSFSNVMQGDEEES